jgi:hypothetical protein
VVASGKCDDHGKRVLESAEVEVQKDSEKRARTEAAASGQHVAPVQPTTERPVDKSPKMLDLAGQTISQQISSLPPNEIEKIRRICCPKRDTGKLDVDAEIFEAFRDGGAARTKILETWVKSGGQKARVSTYLKTRRRIFQHVHGRC